MSEFDLPLDSKYSRAVLQVTVDCYPGTDQVFVWRSKTYFREDGWFPVVEEWINGEFYNGYQYDIPMDDPKIALTIAYSCAKEKYEVFKKICGGFLEISEDKRTEDTF